jgi:hypothetical protein
MGFDLSQIPNVQIKSPTLILLITIQALTFVAVYVTIVRYFN